MSGFIQKLEKKLQEQLGNQKVGFLLGAGSSFLNGQGYPLAAFLWDRIAPDIPEKERNEIQKKLDQGANGIENALDLLDQGEVQESAHRHLVIEAIAKDFKSVQATLDFHRAFLSFLKKRKDEVTSIFSLNYDPLIEKAAEREKIRLYDGFYGHEEAFFESEGFRYVPCVYEKSWKGQHARSVGGNLQLIKLHGSLGWFDEGSEGVRRRNFDSNVPPNSKRLMIPPQHRKAQDTGKHPYSTLWGQYRNALFNGQNPIHRLVTIGYGMRDEHVNSEIENALANNNFTLICLAKELEDEVFERWAAKSNTVIVTENRCSLRGEKGEGHPSLWSFEKLVEELKTW